MPSPDNSPLSSHDTVKELIEKNRYSDLSVAILSLPNDPTGSRGTEELIADIASKLRTRCPAALIASLHKLLELEDLSHLSRATAYQLFVNYCGKDHRICELAVDVLRRKDPSIINQKPYNVHHNDLTFGERHLRDRKFVDALMKDVKEYYLGGATEWPSVDNDLGLPDPIASTRSNYSGYLCAAITNAPKQGFETLVTDEGWPVLNYLAMAYEIGYVSDPINEIRVDMLLNPAFQRIADSIDTIFLNSCPPLMTVPQGKDINFYGDSFRYEAEDDGA